MPIGEYRGAIGSDAWMGVTPYAAGKSSLSLPAYANRCSPAPARGLLADYAARDVTASRTGVRPSHETVVRLQNAIYHSARPRAWAHDSTRSQDHAVFQAARPPRSWVTRPGRRGWPREGRRRSLLFFLLPKLKWLNGWSAPPLSKANSPTVTPFLRRARASCVTRGDIGVRHIR